MFKLFRSGDWWEYKIPPLLAIGYATSYTLDIPLYEALPRFLFLLGAVCTGAVYVSLINDMADIQEDLACGKLNRMSKFLPSVRRIFLVCCIFIGLIFAYFLRTDGLSLVLYALAWIVFTLYSIPPFRFKKRGGLGLLCDASGAHLLPSLLMVSSVTNYSGKQLDLVWFATVGGWAFFYGLRGILYHQFRDRENDLQSGINTFASKVTPGAFRRKARLLTLIEIVFLFVILCHFLNPIVFSFVLLCLFLIFFREIYFNSEIIAVITPAKGNYHILLSDYYQVFLPVSILTGGAIAHPYCWIMLAAHLLVFPKNTINLLKDIYGAYIRLYRSTY